jgi:RNA polymerase sigma-70 factor (ECF subfamily)
MMAAAVADGCLELDDAEQFASDASGVLPAALRLARSAGCAPDEAADAVQDALLAAWRHREQRTGPFAPWFLAIVYRQARRRRRWLTVPLGWRGARDDHQPAGGDPELAAALAQLPERQRTALWLRYGLDMSTADVAGVLGIAETATKQLLYRAREAVRRSLGVRA